MQIATNPQTGEKVQWNGSQWVPLGNAAPQTQGPITVGQKRPEKPEVREVGGSLGIVGNDGSFTPTYTPPPKPEKDGDPKLAEGERKAAGYARRAIGAYLNYRRDGQGARSLAGQVLKDNAPALLNSLPDAVGNSDARRKSDQAELEFISAALRQDSGATIPPEEIAAQRPTWFPSPGDTDPTVLANYDEARKRVIDGLIAAAGNANDPELAALVAQYKQVAATPYAPNFDAAFAGADQAQNANDLPELVAQPKDGPAAVEEAKRKALLEGKLNGAGAGTAGVMGAGDTLTFGMGDEIDAGLNAFADSIRGNESIGDLYDRYLAVNRDYQQQLQSNHGGSYLAGQLAGGLAVPFGAGARGVSQVAKVGAAQGAAYGFGSGENALGRVGGAALGGVTGGVLGAGIGAAAKPVGNALTKFSGASRAERIAEAEAGRGIIEAGERRGIPIRQPDARPSVRNQFAAAEATEGGGPIIRQAINADADAVRADARSLAPGGRARDTGGLGEIAQGAVNRHGERTRNAAQAEYQKVAQLAPDHVGDPAPVVSAIRAQASKLEASGSNATKAERDFLNGIADDFEKSGLSVASLQAQRESARKRMMSAGIDHSAAEARLDEIMKFAGDALDQSLDINPRAQQALRKANQIWAERADFRRAVRDTFLGKRGDVTIETAGQRLEKMFDKGGDSRKFQRVWGEMTDAEKNDVLASVIEGSGARGRNDFSLATLAKSIETMNPRTMVRAFGPDGAKALRDIKTIASAKADTLGGLNNSKSGVVNTHNGITFRTLLFGGLGASVGDVTGLVGGAAVSKVFGRFEGRRAARLLLNDDFRKWLKTIPATTKPEVMNKTFARLNAIASKAPEIAGDAQALQQFLRDSLQESATRAAASDQENNRR